MNFDDELEAEKTAVSIKDLRRTLGFPDDVEFKFHKSSKDVRVKFLQVVNPFKFCVRVFASLTSILRFARIAELQNRRAGLAKRGRRANHGMHNAAARGIVRNYGKYENLYF